MLRPPACLSGDDVLTYCSPQPSPGCGQKTGVVDVATKAGVTALVRVAVEHDEEGAGLPVPLA